ncbi:MAG: NUDIX domain-containing protein [archaeon]|jgi:isopentenyl-diphosphate delta-isomerase type 1
MADELIDVVDPSTGVPTGEKIMKSVAHHKGIFHLAVHIWIYNSSGEVLLQLRAKQKKLFPDLWDISCAGHIGAGEKPLVCAVREMEEELGLKIKPTDLEFAFNFLDCMNANDNMINNEFCPVYLYKYDGKAEKVVLQKEEVAKVNFFKINFLEKEISKETNNKMCLLWKNESVPRVFELIKERTISKRKKELDKKRI